MTAAAARSPLATLVDPDWLDPTSHLAFLKASFPGQWDRAAYDWYVARAFNGRRSEVLVRAEGTRILAGVTLCYRQISVAASPPMDVCVLSAGATVSSERGRGHYDSLLHAALARAREKACGALLGFTTRDNGSARGLIRLGARAIPSFYIVSDDRPRMRGRSPSRAAASRRRAPVHRQRAVDSAFARLARRRVVLPAPSNASQVRFHYERTEDWSQQFIHRPHAVRAIRLAHDSLALIETVRDTDRLQWLDCPDGKAVANIAALVAASAVTARKFFMYTLDPRQAAAARRVGLGTRGGYLLMLPTGHSSAGCDRLAHAVWRVQSGDRL